MHTAELVRQFESGVMPEGGFHHAQHVQVAWHYLCELPLPAALQRFCDALKRFAAAQGSPELYHDHVAHVLFINERLDRSAPRLVPLFRQPRGPARVEAVDPIGITPLTSLSERAKRTLSCPTGRRDRPISHLCLELRVSTTPPCGAIAQVVTGTVLRLMPLPLHRPATAPIRLARGRA